MPDRRKDVLEFALRLPKIGIKTAASLIRIYNMLGHRRLYLPDEICNGLWREQFFEDTVNKNLFNAIAAGEFRVAAHRGATVHIGAAGIVATVFDCVMTAALTTY
jgi:hypothetical protein